MKIQGLVVTLITATVLFGGRSCQASDITGSAGVTPLQASEFAVTLFDQWFSEIQREYDLLVAIRRELHQWPEIGYHTFNTSRTIQRELVNFGITNFTTGWCVGPDMTEGAGIVVDIGTGGEPAVLLRADHDALPVTELADVEYKSRISGRMHACGHDSHTTMLLGAAKLLKQHEREIPGTVRLMFQPGEEGYRGAMYMVQEGVLSRHPPIQRAIASHVCPWINTNQVGLVPGYHMAGAANISVTVTGQHHAVGQPASGADAILASAAIIRTLQGIVSRESTGGFPTDTLVITIATIHAASLDRTVMPKTVKMTGTIRAMKPDRLVYMKRRILRVVTEMAAIHGCSVELQFGQEVPPLYNDPKLAAELLPLIQHASVPPAEIPPGLFVMPSEDFAFVAETVPSALLWIGINEALQPNHYELHSPHISMTEEHIPRGAAMMAAAAMQLLKQLQREN